MRRIKQVLWSKEEILQDFPQNHPLWKYPTDEKIDLALAYFLDLKRKKDFTIVSNTITFMHDAEAFAKIANKAKPHIPYGDLFAITNGIKTPRTRSKEWYFTSYCIGGYRMEARIATLVNIDKRCVFICAINEHIIEYNLRTIIQNLCYDLSSDTDLQRVVSNATNLTAKLKNYQNLQTESKRIMLTTMQEYKDKNYTAFNDALKSLEKSKNNQITEAVELLTKANLGDWKIEGVEDNKFCLTYRKLILADVIFKNIEFEERNIDTLLKFPYFIYKLRITYGGDIFSNQKLKLKSFMSKGYHPNTTGVNLKPDVEIRNWGSVCVGTFDQHRLQITTIEDGKPESFQKFKTALSDLILTMKSVNLGSAYWNPSPSQFLDGFQEYLSQDKLPPPVETSPDQAYEELYKIVCRYRIDWDGIEDAEFSDYGRNEWIKRCLKKHSYKKMIDILNEYATPDDQDYSESIKRVFEGLKMWEKANKIVTPADSITVPEPVIPTAPITPREGAQQIEARLSSWHIPTRVEDIFIAIRRATANDNRDLLYDALTPFAYIRHEIDEMFANIAMPSNPTEADIDFQNAYEMSDLVADDRPF